MYNPFTEEDIYDIKNMLDDIEELENSYYNLDGEYPIKNENDPLVDKRIRRIVTSCLSSSFETFIALWDEKSPVVRHFFTVEEKEYITSIRNRLAHEYAKFSNRQVNLIVSHFIPIVKTKLESVINIYDHFDELSEYDKERIITPSGDENKKIKTNISISNKILEHDSDIRFKNF